MIAPDYQTPDRLDKKLRAIPFPDMTGMRVLDVGCDMGFWCRYALANGAKEVTGLDRGRLIRGQFVNLANWNSETHKHDSRANFLTFNLGKEYWDIGNFDLVLMFSLYHHVYQNTGGIHEPIWYWLWRQMKLGATLLWENPVSTADAVVRKDVSPEFHADYTQEKILAAAQKYFSWEYIGPALHEPTREVFRFTSRHRSTQGLAALLQEGAGGASKAFEYDNFRRCKEIGLILGIYPYAGSLNCKVSEYAGNLLYAGAPFFRAKVLDVEQRGAGLDVPWVPRWARFYPITIKSAGEEFKAWAFRFENEKYPKTLVELVSGHRLRDFIEGAEAILWIE